MSASSHDTIERNIGLRIAKIPAAVHWTRNDVPHTGSVSEQSWNAWRLDQGPHFAMKLLISIPSCILWQEFGLATPGID